MTGVAGRDRRRQDVLRLVEHYPSCRNLGHISATNHSQGFFARVVSRIISETTNTSVCCAFSQSGSEVMCLQQYRLGLELHRFAAGGRGNCTRMLRAFATLDMLNTNDEVYDIVL